MTSLPGCVFLSAVLLVGCGYVGDPLPPSLNIPSPVSDLSILEHGDEIIISFTIPKLTTDGMVLREVGSAELRAGLQMGEPFDPEEWAANSKQLEVSVSSPGPVRLAVPAQEWVGREVLFRVRISNEKGRTGKWSDFAKLKVLPPLDKPYGLHAVGISSGVRLTWQMPDQRSTLSFRVYRSTADAPASLVAHVEKNEWVDVGIQYGTRYRYSVQALVGSGELAVESEISTAFAIVPVDHFPPATPVGLKVVGGVASVGLTWEHNSDADLAGYRVYRGHADGPYVVITTLLPVPSYTDWDVQRGQRYRYAVSAVDTLGNESPLCAAVYADTLK